MLKAHRGGRTAVRAALLLRRSRPSGGDERLVAEARSFARSMPVPVRLQVCVSLDGALAYIYVWVNFQALNGHRMPGARLARLAPLGEWRGVSAGQEAPYHYVVATDIEAGWEAEFNRWYDSEHMPGLAAVPGSVYCVRLRSLDGGPHYHSCYDLTSPQALERDEWLTVRNSFSSSRVRPHFLNTRRIMFRTLLDERRSGAFMEHVF
ncbi:MAG: hypothetical protein E6H44_07290 [Betaproteobacteria bacterium]|nr:MAG: hypothetical protein E6H44_07290 [Betaproteobacteria bacterium]TMI08109.1 MAG: hypothetical protein E6H40_12755 [Betaproteobacteria bacterium]